MASTSGDTLITASRRYVEVSQHRGPNHEARRSYCDVVDRAIANKESYRRLLGYGGECAQLVMDALSSLLPLLNQSMRANVLKAYLRLARFSNVLPSKFYLTNIEDVQRLPALETPSTDIYRGVYQGRNIFLKRYRFCCGSLSQKDRAELLNREAVIWAHHQHSGVLPFIGVFQRDDGPYDSGLYLVSPFLENGTIVGYLQSHPKANRRLLAKDILSAMSYLHSNNITHGDIKGVNVLVTSSGHACLADLGYSRLTEAAIRTWTSVQSVVCVGTYQWQAPELLAQARVGGRIVPTRAADIYSIGCLFYEVFTNQDPFWNLEPNASTAYRVYYLTEAVVERDERPSKPEASSKAFKLYGLTEEIFAAMEWSWHREPSSRPSASQLLALPFLLNVVDDRPRYEA